MNTVNEKFQLPEMQKPSHVRRRLMLMLAGTLTATCVLVWCLLFFIGISDEYHDMRTHLIAAEERNALLEQQMSTMLAQGDQGILIANIGADLVGWQVRLTPVVKNGKEK